MNTSAQGIILFAHGSRDPLWHKPMEAVAQQIQLTNPQMHVVCAYLELSTPDLATAAQTLIDAGVRLITIVPMFLGVGKHAREDLPLLVTALSQAHPSMEFTLQKAVGEDHRLIQVLARIALNHPE
jgi:sirohydrochlorin cobaltochelatase